MLSSAIFAGRRRMKQAQKSRNRPARASILILCQCSECVAIQNFKPTKGIFNGAYLTQYQHEEHSSLERRRQMALLHLQANPNESSPLAQGVSDATEPSAEENKSEWTEETSWHGISTGTLDALEETVPHSKPDTSTPAIGDELKKVQLGLDATPAASFQESLERIPLVYVLAPEVSEVGDHCHHDHDNLFELDLAASANFAYTQYNTWLFHIKTYLHYQRNRQMSNLEHAKFTFLVKKVTSELEGMDKVRRDHWLKRRSASEAERHRRVETAQYVDATLQGIEPITAIVYIMTLMLHFFGNLSHVLSLVNLQGIALALSVALRQSRDVDLRMIPTSIPKDIRTITSRINLEPCFKTFVCCPNCFKTFRVDPDNPFLFPKFCDYQQTPNSKPCGSRLRDHSTTEQISSPVRVFLYQDLQHWIGRLHARADLEGLLDEYPSSRRKGGVLKDIWDGSVLRDFRGPDGKPFLLRPQHESRLVFGLNMDGFNPYGNREAGKKVSIGGIYLVCFNLPPHLRYRMENVFLAGLIPGPQEPSTHQVNHLLRPVIDNLQILWERGIFLTKTSIYATGRPVRAALIPLICDLPAARRAVGMGSHSSTNFCSDCRQKLKDINDLDIPNWPARDYPTHVQCAEAWRDASTEESQTQIFKVHGIKWSELLCLPYWDPTKFVVMDSMHGFYLRMFMRHVRDVWGMRVNIRDGDGAPGGDIPELSEDTVAELQRVLRYEPITKLQGLKKAQLQYLCRDAGLHFGGQKSWLTKLLVEYRIEQGWFTSDGDLIFGPSRPAPSPSSIQEAAPNPESTPTPSSVIPDTTSIPNPGTLDASSNTSPTSLPSCPQHPSTALLLPPGALTMQDVDMKLFYQGSKSAIDAARKEVLVRICTVTQPSGAITYSSKTRLVLTDLIHQQRMAAGITTSNHKVVKAGTSSSTGLPTVPQGEQVELERLYQSGSKSALSRARKALLVAMCAIRFAETSHDYKEFNQMNKDALLELLHERRLAEGIVDEDGDLLSTEEQKETAVLGTETLSEIRRDMQSIDLPSWFSPAPKHPGEVKWGKFKADEWKAFCLVNLPITLTRLWGVYPKESRQYQMLENYMALVNAVKVATSRSITSGMIVEYEAFMLRYLEGFLRLYPHKNLTPYQHLSLHFGEHLRRFGPTHSWRCYAFERMNGLVQDLPSNSRLGELEKTKFLRFCRTQNLRGMLNNEKIPLEAYPLVKLYLNHFGGACKEHDDSSNAPTGTGTPSLLDHTEFRFLKHLILSQNPQASQFSRQITLYSKYQQGRNRFTSDTSKHSQSAVLFSSGNLLDVAKPGVITSIFSFTYSVSHVPDNPPTSQLFAIVKPYLDLQPEDVEQDPFRPFGLAGGTLCRNIFGTPELIPFSSIYTHFARTPLHIHGILDEVIHVLPLVK